MIASISCPDRKLLRSLLDGHLPPDTEHRVSAHLEQCPTCQTQLEQTAGGAHTLGDVARNLRGARDLSESLKRVIEKCASDPLMFVRDESSRPTADGKMLARSASSRQAAKPPASALAPPAENSPADGQRLGHYKILGTIGSGGMGLVLKAHDPKLNRIVAIKVLAANLAADETSRLRFIREARSAAAINHHNVVTIHAVDDSAEPYLVMEFIEGTSLRMHLAHNKPLKMREVLRIGMHIAKALEASHAKGVVHRDVKPDNILLDSATGGVKLTDFGLARIVGDFRFTQSGIVIGTPPFMSPEQALGKTVDPRSDLFSLGSVIYAMCTGRVPFDDNQTMSTLESVCNAQTVPPQQLNPAVPDWLADLIRWLHARQPEDRPESAGEIARILKQRLTELLASTKIVRQASKRSPASVPIPPEDTRVAESPPTFVPETHDGTNQRTALHGKDLFFGKTIVEQRLRMACAAVVSIGLVIGIFSTRTKTRAPPQKQEMVESNPPPESVAGHSSDKTEPMMTPRSTPAATSEPDRAEFHQASFLLSNHAQPFATLSEAIAAAALAGDTIEISGGGPLVIPPLVIHGKSLRIYSAAGQRPILQLEQSASEDSTLIETDSDLVLEGLELACLSPARQVADASLQPPLSRSLVRTRGTQLRAANCRFSIGSNGHGLVTNGTALVTLRNCEFDTEGFAVSCVPHEDQQLLIRNCILHAPMAVALLQPEGGLLRPTLELRSNTVVASCLLLPHLPAAGRLSHQMPPDPLPIPWRILADDNLFHSVQSVLGIINPPPPRPRDGNFRLRSQWLFHAIHWTGHRNAYSGSHNFVKLKLPINGVWVSPAWGPQTLKDWQHLWDDNETDSLMINARFDNTRIGPPFHHDDLHRLQPSDFRPEDDSLDTVNGVSPGAILHEVGPGLAYENFLRSPEYRTWLNEQRVPASH